MAVLVAWVLLGAKSTSSDTPKGVRPLVPSSDGLAFTEAGDRWRFVVTSRPGKLFPEDDLTVYRNGRRVSHYRAATLNGLGLEVQRLRLGRGRSVVGVLAYPAAGHPTAKHLFMVRRHRLLHIGAVGGENGGPLFRDEDGDGRPEWIFDNYSWYQHYTKGPTSYLIFKLTRAGKLRLWRRRGNLKRTHLPDRFGFKNAG